MLISPNLYLNVKSCRVKARFGKFRSVDKFPEWVFSFDAITPMGKELILESCERSNNFDINVSIKIVNSDLLEEAECIFREKLSDNHNIWGVARYDDNISGIIIEIWPTQEILNSIVRFAENNIYICNFYIEIIGLQYKNGKRFWRNNKIDDIMPIVGVEYEFKQIEQFE